MSSKPNMVARMPCLYWLVPSTMSFSVWPITFRHIRSTAFALMPVGMDLASGRWVASMMQHAERRAALGQVGGDLLQLGAVGLVLEGDLALIDGDHDRVQAEPLVGGQLGRDLVLRAQLGVLVGERCG